MDFDIQQYKWFRVMDDKPALKVRLFGVPNSVTRRVNGTKYSTITILTYSIKYKGKDYIWREEMYSNEKKTSIPS